MMELKQIDDPMVLYPKKSRRNTRLQELIDQFVRSDLPYAEVTYDEEDYTSGVSARNALAYAAKRSGYNIRVRRLDGYIYLIKKH